MALDPTRRLFTGPTGIPAVEVSVLWVQQRLNAALAPSDRPRIAEDGVWGSQTSAALREFFSTVLRAPTDSATYAAQILPGSTSRIGMTKPLESALAGGSTSSTAILFGGFILATGLFLYGSQQYVRGGMRGIRTRRRRRRR